MSEALLYLAVGMLTVFTALAFVVGIGNSIIWFANKYLPAEVKAAPAVSNIPPPQPSGFSRSKVAAITAAVDFATKGKGKITNINKV